MGNNPSKKVSADIEPRAQLVFPGTSDRTELDVLKNSQQALKYASLGLKALKTVGQKAAAALPDPTLKSIGYVVKLMDFLTCGNLENEIMTANMEQRIRQTHFSQLNSELEAIKRRVWEIQNGGSHVRRPLIFAIQSSDRIINMFEDEHYILKQHPLHAALPFVAFRAVYIGLAKTFAGVAQPKDGALRETARWNVGRLNDLLGFYEHGAIRCRLDGIGQTRACMSSPAPHGGGFVTWLFEDKWARIRATDPKFSVTSYRNKVEQAYRSYFQNAR